MSSKFDHTHDDDFRIILSKKDSEPKPNKEPERTSGTFRRKWIAAAIFIAAILIIAVSLLFLMTPRDSDNNVSDEIKVFEPELYEVQDSTDNITDSVIKLPLGSNPDSIKGSFTEVISRSINDVEIDIYIPHNATPRLRVGIPPKNDNSIIFATQAADLRADNGKIVGAFVLAGEPLSWGLSKKGFCAMIGDTITIGMSENSPLFEEATEKGGYFFRQYALVNNGRLVYNNLRNKSERKALCQRGNEIFVVTTRTKESMHDFAQVLVDLGVENAIYLIGSRSYYFYRGADGEYKSIYRKPSSNNRHSKIRKNINYIEWVTNK